MFRDVRQWLNSGYINDVWYVKFGGIVFYVVVVKGYMEVLKFLIQVGYDVNIKDYDGWIFFYVVVYWGKEEVC